MQNGGCSPTKEDPFEDVKKYSLTLTPKEGAPATWDEIFHVPIKEAKCLEVRVVFTKYEGNVLGTKLGIGINDYSGAVCSRHMSDCVSVATSATNTSAEGK